MQARRAVVIALLALLCTGAKCQTQNGICSSGGGGGNRTSTVNVMQNAVVGDVTINQQRLLSIGCYSHGVPAQNVFSQAYGWVNIASIGAVARCDKDTDREACRRVAHEECRVRLTDFVMTSGGGFLNAGCGPAICESCIN